MSDEPTSPPGQPRRGFLAGLGALAAGALAVVPPVFSGLASLLDPLRKSGVEAGMVRVTQLGVLPRAGRRRSSP